MSAAQLALFAGGFAAGVLFTVLAIIVVFRIVAKLGDDIPDNLTDGDEYPASVIRRGK